MQNDHPLMSTPQITTLIPYSRHCRGCIDRRLDYFLEGPQFYAQRSVWPPGPASSALWAWHQVGVYTWIASVFTIRLLALLDFKRRVELPIIHGAVNAIIAIQFVSPMALLVADYATGHSWCGLEFVLEYCAGPLIFVICCDATYKDERERLARWEDAQTALRHACEVAATKQTFLR